MKDKRRRQEFIGTCSRRRNKQRRSNIRGRIIRAVRRGRERTKISSSTSKET
jgi:hypothetical protein